MQDIQVHSEQRRWLLPILVGVGGVYLLKDHLRRDQRAQAWVTGLQRDAQLDVFWTRVILIYSAVVAATFWAGYRYPRVRPALLAWYLF